MVIFVGFWAAVGDGYSAWPRRRDYYELPTFDGLHRFPCGKFPEPGSITLVVAGGLCLAAYAWRRFRLS